MFGGVCAAAALATLLGEACGNTQLVWMDGRRRTFSKTSELWTHAQESEECLEMKGKGRMTEMLHIASFDFRDVAGLDKERLGTFLLEFAEECYCYRYHVICIQNITRGVFERLRSALQGGRGERYLAVESIDDRLVHSGKNIRCTDYATFFDSDLIVCIDSMVSTMHSRYTYESMQRFFLQRDNDHLFGIKMSDEEISNETALLTYFSTLKTNVRFKVANFINNAAPRKLPMLQVIADLNFYIGLECNPASHKFIVGNFNVSTAEFRRGFFLHNFMKNGCIPGCDYNFVHTGPNDPASIAYEVMAGLYRSDAFETPFKDLYAADSLSYIFRSEEVRHFADLVERTSPMRISSSTRFRDVHVQSCVGCYIVSNCYDDDGYSLVIRSSSEGSGRSDHLKKKRTMEDIIENLEEFSMEVGAFSEASRPPEDSTQNAQSQGGCIIF